MKILSRRILCENPTSPFNYFGWPSITRLPDGALAMACSGFRMRHVCPFGKGIISYSRDEGQSWTRPAPVIDTPLDDRDSGVVSFGNGRVIFTSFNNSSAMQRGRALRLNEDTPLEAAQKAFTLAYLDLLDATEGSHALLGSTYRISDDGGYTFGKTLLSPVTSPHGPAPAPDGGLLYVGRRFSADDGFDDGTEPFLQCCRLNAQDRFEPISYIPNIPDGQGGFLHSCEPHALFVSEKRVIVHIRVQGGCFTTYQSVSNDGGQSFSAPVRLLDVNGGAPAHLMRHSSGALLSVYGYRSEPYGIRYMLSGDLGESWTTDLVLEDGADTADLGYPASVELSDGSVLTVYYQRSEGGSAIRCIHWEL